jgi:type III secretion protein C
MLPRRSPRPFLQTFVLACAVFVTAFPSHAEPPPWPESSFSYIAKEQQLEKVLAGFAKTFALELRLETALPEGLAALSGRSAAATPTEFLNQLSAAYGLTWYYHTGTIYISRTSERTTRMVPTKGMSGAALKRAFTQTGIIEPRFGWAEVDERSAILLSGPPSYVERIEKAIGTFPDAVGDQQIMVFRLKHASVEDRTIQYRDKELVIPGVATMLRGLLGDPRGSGATSVTGVSTGADTAAAAGGATRPYASGGDSAAALRPAPPANTARAQDTPSAAQRPMIQSDARLNAILIKDKPQNAPIYKDLIEALDVAGNHIEIEAAIVDVNTSSMGELGVDWNGRFGKVTAGFEGGAITLARAASPVSAAAEAANFLMTRIRILEGKGNARIVSRPFILTQDNMNALIDLSDTFYIQTVGERVATVTNVSVGVTLRVTPRVLIANGVRSVQLTLDIEDGSIGDNRVGLLPTVRRSTISTQAVVGENESLLIGGFNSEQTLHSKSQVPVLGDVPIFGAMFGKTVGSTEKRERMFVITPKIVSDRIGQAAAQAVQQLGAQP